LGCGLQSFFEIINPPPVYTEDDSETIIGFKTVRYHKSTGATLTNLLQFIKDAFPCSRIIMNIRSNSTEQTLARTRWFERTSSATIVKDIIKDENKKLIQMYNMLGTEQAKLLIMANWTLPKIIGKEEVYEDLNHVIEWLGYQNCTVTKLYHENNNGFERHNNGSMTVTTSNRLGKHCHYQGY